MEAFWTITIIMVTLWFKWRSYSTRIRQEQELEEAERERALQKATEKTKQEVDKQLEADIKELKKQGYTDELIAVILPTINNDK